MSMRSEASMGRIIEFKSEDTKTDLRYVFMFSAVYYLRKYAIFIY